MELSKQITIRYTGVPGTSTIRATQRYPKDKPDFNDITDVSAPQWTEAFDNVK